MNLVKSMLEDAGISQSELAERTNMTEVSISRYVNGSREPKFSTMCKIATACGFYITVKPCKIFVSDMKAGAENDN